MNGKRKITRQLLSMVLCIILTLSCVPVQSYATEDIDTDGYTENAVDVETTQEELTQEELTQEEFVTQSSTSDVDLPDNDELFEGYLEQLFYGNGEISTIATGDHAVGATLTGDAKTAYDALVPVIKKIANGERDSSSTVIRIGQPYNGEEPDVEVKFESINAVELINNKIIYALLNDCPYEMYWYDKTKGATLNSLGYENQPPIYIEFRFKVAENYQESGNLYAVDSSKAEAAVEAAENARAIVEANKGFSDYEKLVNYRDKICDLTDYDHKAAENTEGFSTNDDPWQLVYIFDGDPETKVVCEGYSKAYQYLCDLTTFNDDISCYSVTGTMDGGTGAGAHMWNIVTMEDGENYLVDITNSDEGTAGVNGELFLAGGRIAEKDFISTDSEGIETLITLRGYEFDAVYGMKIFYTYSDDTKYTWNESVLTISDHDYVPPKYYPVNFQGTNVVSDGEGTASNKLDYQASLTPERGYILPNTITVQVNGNRLAASDYTYENGSLIIPKERITGPVKIIASATKCTHAEYDYTANENVITAVCKTCGTEKTVTLYAENSVYDGTVKSAVVTGDLSANVIYEKDGTVLSAAPVNVGTYIAKITLGGATVSVEYTIAAASLEQAEIQVASSVTYTGAEITPPVTVILGGKTLTANDYDLSYSNNINAGIATVTITGKGNYAGTVSKDFEISPQTINGYTIETSNESFTYDGTEKTYQSVVVKKGNQIIPEEEYQVAYSNNVNAGTNSAKLTISDVDGGNYVVTGQSKMFTIGKRNITIKAEDKSMKVKADTPEFTYAISSGTLAEGDLCSNVTFSCDGANGQIAGTFDITVSDAVIKNADNVSVVNNYNITYVKGTLTVAGHEHQWTYEANDNKITATCSVEGCDLPSAVIALLPPSNLIYTGSPKEATISISGEIDGVILPDIQYTGDCINAGVHTASITLGDATATLEFTIEKAIINQVKALKVTEPAVGAEPQSNIDSGDDRYNGTISWNPEGTFEYDTAYTATVTLTPDDNHQFANDITVEGFEVHLENGILTLTKAFDPIERGKVTDIEAPSVSRLNAYCSDVSEAIAKLPNKVNCTTNRGEKQVGITWSCENYDSTANATNTFTWTVRTEQLADYDWTAVETTGTVRVQNADYVPVNHSAKNAVTVYNGSTYDVSKMFTLDAHAGDVTYAIVAGGTGEGTLDGSRLTITKAGTIRIKVTTAPNGAYGAGEASAILTVNRAAGSGKVTMEGWTYGENAKAPVSSSQTNTNVAYKYVGTGTTVYEENTAVPTNAGTYKVIAVFAENDLYASCRAEAQFAIAKAAGTVSNKSGAEAYAEEYLFTNSAITAPTADNFTTNSGSTDFVFTWYAGNTVDESKKMTGAPLAVGRYTLLVNAAETANYTAASTTVAVEIKVFSTNAVAETADTNKGNNGWFVGDVTIMAPEGFTISTSQGVNTFGNSLTVSEDRNGEYSYYLKDSAGHITAEKTIMIKRDTVAPDGEIKIAESSFKELMNKISFGLFFKNTVNVKINSEDALSGVASVEYQKVSKEADYRVNGTWTKGDRLSVTANEKFILYARITDAAGNVKIINSNGVVVYTDSAQVTANLVYVKTTKNDVPAEVALNGNVIDTIHIEKNKITEKLVEGTDYSVNAAGNVIKLSGTYLDALKAGSYKFTVSYKPMGEVYVEAQGNEAPLTTTISLKVELAEGTIDSIEDLTKVYDGKPVDTPKVTTTNDISDKMAVTTEYKLKGADDNTYTTTAPTEAGEYTVRVTVAADGVYDTVSAEKNFKITKAEVSAAIDPSVTSQAPGKSVAVTVTVQNPSENILPATMEVKVDTGKGADGIFDTVKVTQTKAGTYTGNYIVPADLKAGSVMIMSVDTTDKNFAIANPEDSITKITVNVKEQTALPAPMPENDQVFKMDMQTGITEVPEALKDLDALNTVKKVETAMQTVVIEKNSKIAKENIKVYDVELMYSGDSGKTWAKADSEHFPSNGKVKIVLPYPSGTGKDTHNFTVAHMFTSDSFGKTPGNVEYPAVTKTAQGLVFEVTGLSPISVGWEVIKKPVDEGNQGNNDSSDKPNDSKKPSSSGTESTLVETIQAPAAGTQPVNTAQTTGTPTGDNNLFVWYGFIALLAGAGFISLCMPKYYKKKD